MHRYVSLAAVWIVVLLPTSAWADAFDRYTNTVLSQVPGAPGVVPIAKLTPDLALQQHLYISDNDGILLIVKTNDGLSSKMLVKFARQRFGDRTLPIAILERVTTYKAGHERVLQASAPLVQLYEGFHFHLGLAQVVPSGLPADLRFSAPGTEGQIEPVGKATLYLLTQPLPGAEPVKKSPRPALSDAFDPTMISGVYRLYDDGRRTARLTLRVNADGLIAGDYVSEQTGRQYEVAGKILSAKHQLQFVVKFPQVEQSFLGHAFTRDVGALAGTTTMQGREFGFYAIRLDDE
jgi:hypothetical protein